MKTCLIALCLFVIATSSLFAETYRAPVNRQRQKQQPERQAPPMSRGDVDGVIPRGIRGGNFLQMFNPKAPARYGTSQEAISYDPSPMHANTRHNETGKWRGIKLFVFRF
ncbi:MAG TPA: hypothetical protein VM940_06365 [Chthoniobacterales bacterium]|jgi:hypothetical protein|nr:hypothetical protein [Chthoniobacterales bacterium]